MAIVDENEVRAYREQAFLAFCSEKGLMPTDELREAHRAGSICGVEFIKIKVGPLLAMLKRPQRRVTYRTAREERGVLNLWGLLP